MPRISARFTQWHAISVDVRSLDGCPLYDEGVCDHPKHGLYQTKPLCFFKSSSAATSIARCPLEEHPVLLYRAVQYEGGLT
jgi:hypothetical protein